MPTAQSFYNVIDGRLAAIIDAILAVPRESIASLTPAERANALAAIRIHAQFPAPSGLPMQLSTLLHDSPEVALYAKKVAEGQEKILAALLALPWGEPATLSASGGTLQTTDNLWKAIPQPRRNPAAVSAAIAPLVPAMGFRLSDRGNLLHEGPRFADAASDTLPVFISARAREVLAGRMPRNYVFGRDDLAWEDDELVDSLRAARRYLDVSFFIQNIHEHENAAAAALAPLPRVVNAVENLKSMLDSARSSKDDSGSLATFQSFPVVGRRARQAKASRTWGVELEVTDAGRVYSPSADMKSPERLLIDKSLDVPQGWAAVRDGSLRNMIGDGKWYDPWEFVSPIISTTFDAGLRHLCSQIDGTVKYQRAGVHIHVNATDRHGASLSRHHIDRLLTLYNSVSPLFDPFLMRRSREFCKPYDLEEWVQGWRGRSYPEKAARFLPGDPRHGIRGTVPGDEDPVENVKLRMRHYKAGSDDNTHRYRDVNVESLVKHGTIEFRALGAVYNYEHIIRWAWMCREMVNYAASSRPLSFLTSVSTLDEFLARLRTVAVEPLSLTRSEIAALAS